MRGVSFLLGRQRDSDAGTAFCGISAGSLGPPTVLTEMAVCYYAGLGVVIFWFEGTNSQRQGHLSAGARRV